MNSDLIYVLLLIAVAVMLVVLLVAVWSAFRRSSGGRLAMASSGPVDAGTGLGAVIPTTTTVMPERVPVAPARDGAEQDEGAEQESITDRMTGLAGRVGWAEAFRNEESRHARYRHSTTILVAELHGLDALADRVGQEAADRLIPPVADALRRNARHADIIARVGHAEFFAILPETDQIAAINYVERVRTACDLWLEAGAVTVRLVIGWASPPAGGTLSDALTLAQQRMNAARPARPGGPVGAPAVRPVVDSRKGDAP